MKQLVLCLLLLVASAAYAQSDWQEALREWLTAEDMEEAYSEELMEQLEERALTPINLNQTSQEELEALPFLTAQQVEGLIEYLDRYHPIRSLSELHHSQQPRPGVWPVRKSGRKLCRESARIPATRRIALSPSRTNARQSLH